MAALIFALTLPAGTAIAATRYRVSADSLFVRNNFGSYAIGLLYGSSTAGPNVGGAEAIDIQKKTSDGVWGYGRAYGHFGQWNGYHCGWVLMSALNNTGNSVSNACPDNSQSILDPTLIFESGSYEGGPYDAVIVPCANPYVYGNYDPGTQSFSNRYPTPLPVGRGTLYSPNKYPGVVTSGYSGFKWRYRTKDGRAVLIKDTQSPAGGGTYNVPSWHFVRAECIRRLDAGASTTGLWISGHGVGSSNQLMGDINADGRDDAVAFFNNGSCTAYCGAWYVAPSNGFGFNNYYQAAYGHGVGSTNQFLADVNGDGRDDAIVYFQDTGSWYVALANQYGTFNNYYQGISGHGVGSSSRLMGDVNGDGRDDAVAFFNNGTCPNYCGAWYVAPSNGFGFNNYYRATYGHGVGSTNQFLADVNGDGRDDAIVYFQDTGSWYVALANQYGTFNNYYQGISGHGVGSDSRLMADVNGDGRDDAVVFFKGTGSWYVALSNGSGFNNYYLWKSGFGTGSDRQLLADANGDGRADAVAYYASSGSWYVSP